MVSKSALSQRERELRSRLHSLINEAEDFIHGTPVELSRKCGNPNCKCATNDEHRHRALTLGQTRKGKSSTLYIPKNLEPKVLAGIDHFKQAQEILEELNIEARKRLEKAKKKKQQTKPAKKKTSSPKKPS